jgi:ribokinase
MARVVCAGHVNWDVTLHVDALPDPDGEANITEHCQAGGGSASNTATALAGLGHEPVLLGSLGADRYAEFVEGELDEAGVEDRYLRRVPDRETTVKYLVVDESGEVFVLANDGANEAYEASDLPADSLASAAYLHLTSQHPDTARRLLERARNQGVPVSFDPGRRLGTRRYDDLLADVDLLFLNEREAETARANGTLSSREGATVIKRGDGGATLRRDGEGITHGGFEVPATDTAGAGDAFAAGFLAAKSEGEPDEEALAVANACGAVAVQSVGARVSPTREAVESYRQ